VEKPSVGDLVKWVTDYKIYEAKLNGEVIPIEPVWAYGIILEVSSFDPLSVILVRLDQGTHQIFHMIHDGFIIISKANGE
jgi:hypothetical protein